METNEDDLCIPRSAMYKLVKELVPQVRLSSEAKDLIVTCCNEFIHLLASEANTVCEKQSKKLILPDHVLMALDNLGFSEYKKDCLEVMKQMQEETDKRKKLSKPCSGIPEEELLRQQNELFAEARKQQELADNTDEWSKMQQAAQQALQRQASTTNGNGASNGAISILSNNGTPHLDFNNANLNSNAQTNAANGAIASLRTLMSYNSVNNGSLNNNGDDDDNYD